MGVSNFGDIFRIGPRFGTPPLVETLNVCVLCLKGKHAGKHAIRKLGQKKKRKRAETEDAAHMSGAWRLCKRRGFEPKNDVTACG